MNRSRTVAYDQFELMIEIHFIEKISTRLLNSLIGLVSAYVYVHEMAY